MTVKVKCISCGFEFESSFIKYHNKKPYCDFCSLDLIMNNNNNSNILNLPSFYLTREHQENFMILYDDLVKLKNINWLSLINAYILAVPSIYKCQYIYKITNEYSNLFKTVSFVWQFDFIIYEMKESRINNKVIPHSMHYKLRVDQSGNPEQNRFIKRLPLGSRMMLRIGYLLQFDIFTQNEIIGILGDDYLNLTKPYIKMVDEIFRYFKLIKET